MHETEASPSSRRPRLRGPFDPPLPLLAGLVCLLCGSCSAFFAGDDPVAGPAISPIEADGRLADGSPGDASLPPDGVVQGGDVDAGGGDDGGGQPDVVAVCAPPCPTGYACHDPQDGKGPSCWPDPAWSCLPCTSDSQCLGGECVAVGGEGTFCRVPCAPSAGGQGSCGAGMSCVQVEGEPRCLPDTGSCTCHGGVMGEKRPCGAQVAPGCKGEQTCGPTGWSICDAPAAAEEVCDGVDNDCDGAADEGLPGSKPCSVSTPEGTCAGVATCQGEAGWVCQAPKPATEICDGADNDCDGLTDEPWLNEGKYVAGAHCGVCGNDCSGVFSNGYGTCDPDGFPPHCVLAGCEPGYVPSPEGGCEPKVVGACTPCLLDADCGPFKGCVAPPTPLPGVGKVCAAPCAGGKCAPGMKCVSLQGKPWCVPTAVTCTCNAENAGQKRPCSRSTAAGTCFGVEVCAPPKGWTGCTAKSPAVETCNGVDDDCDGALDEDVGAGSACAATNGWGSCAGELVCGGSAGASCDAKQPAMEVCNGVDDDCDGATDEGFVDPATGAYVHVLHCGGCGKKCPVPAVPNAAPACALEAGTPTCGLTCKPGFVNANGELADGCECSPKAKTDDPDGSDKNCDGVDGDASKAVFVAKTGNDAWPGTVSKPLRTIPAGIARAVKLGRPHVYVGAGAFIGNVKLAPGVSIFGGFSQKFGTRAPAAYETLIIGVAPPVGDAMAVRCEGLSFAPGAGKAVLDGVTILGAAAKAAGRSSYALHVAQCGALLEVRGCRIVAGKGAPGAAGLAGTNGAPGAPGATGGGAYDIGHLSCGLGDHNPGGKGGARQCGPVVVSGGSGGTAICPDFNEKISPPKCSLGYGSQVLQVTKWAERGKNGVGPAGGKGGLPGGDAYIDPHDGKTTQCKTPKYGCSDCVVPFNALNGRDGKHGAPGPGGPGGKACASAGAIVAGVWTPGHGGQGAAGGPGSGGGGGGAAGGVEVVACKAQALYTDIGGSGGGGGSGGCGGAGGKGGQGGGAAMAVFVLGDGGAAPTLLNNTLVGGQGGPGGGGGSGGYGGVGGGGGAGGKGAYSQPATKCASHGGLGGNGGHGGHGGGGGGGCGGPSVLLGAHGVPPLTLAKWKQSNKLASPGAGGAGGPGGVSAAGKGADGSPGAALGVHLWP